MDLFQLTKEQRTLAAKIILRDGFSKVKIIAGARTVSIQNKLSAVIITCTFPECQLLEVQSYQLANPLPYKPGLEAYREMPALIEAYNRLEQEPDIIMVYGTGILHPLRFGVAAHVGLAVNKPSLGVIDSLPYGRVQQGKIFLNDDLAGFEVRTRAHANPIYISPGHLISLGSTLKIIEQTIKYPHKMPEPLHLAHKMARRIQKGQNIEKKEEY